MIILYVGKKQKSVDYFHSLRVGTDPPLLCFARSALNEK